MSSDRKAGCIARLAAVSLAVGAVASTQAADLESIVVMPTRGQSADRARRDRYECHNWAIEESGVIPPPTEQQEAARAAQKAERVDRVLTGAAIGSAIGGFVRATQGKNPSHGVLAGGAVGAAAGAIGGRDRDDSDEESAFDEYFRALSACLEGRGYAVTLAETGDGAASS